MKCDKAQEFFSDYIESTLDRPMTVALESHLSGCETCSADVASLRSLFTVLDKVPQVEPPADFVWKTTTRLQNEMLNRREAELARPLPWWKRLTPVQSFSYAGVAALLVIGLAFPFSSTVQTAFWSILPVKHEVTVQPPPPVTPVTAPQFNAQVTGQNGNAATVQITATSTMPNASVAMAYLSPERGQLKGRWVAVSGSQAVVMPVGRGWPLTVSAGGTHAVGIKVMSSDRGVVREFVKFLLLPGTEPPVTSLQGVDPYFALQQVANQTGQAMLVDGGLTKTVSLDLQSVAPQQALGQVLDRAGAQTAGMQNGVLSITAQ